MWVLLPQGLEGVTLPRALCLYPHSHELDVRVNGEVWASVMLFASREELASDTQVRLLAIRNRELDWLIKNCNYVAQLSALLAGYGYTALIYTKYLDADLCDPNEPLCAEMTYPLCVTITMCLSILSLFGSMLITLLAPALALRGPQGSLNKCIDMTIQEYQYALAVFTCAVVMLLVSTALWSMTQRLFIAAILMTVVLLGSVVLIILTSMKALVHFDAPRVARPQVLGYDASSGAPATRHIGPRSTGVADASGMNSTQYRGSSVGFRGGFPQSAGDPPSGAAVATAAPHAAPLTADITLMGAPQPVQGDGRIPANHSSLLGRELL
jgi:hypothetical protein